MGALTRRRLCGDRVEAFPAPPSEEMVGSGEGEGGEMDIASTFARDIKQL